MTKYRFDGAFGTYYRQLGGKERVCEEANLSEPALVKQIHTEYLEAGANAIKTNTFAANLSTVPDPAHLDTLLSAAYRLAKEAAAAFGAAVFADIGCVGLPEEQASFLYLDTAKRFLKLGAKEFLFETLDSLEPLSEALSYLKSECPDAFVILSFAVAEDGYTRIGKYDRELVEKGLTLADMIGLNCICGPSVMLSRAKQLKATFQGAPLLFQPNAGFPARRGDEIVFSDNSYYFGEKLAEIAALGVSVGGCCGTMPKHMKEAYTLIDRGNIKVSSLQTVLPKNETCPKEKIFPDGRKLLAVELNPPLGGDPAFFFEAAERLANDGADLLTVTDSPLARARADAFMLSGILRQRYGVNVMPHLTCRDRNRVAIKSSLLAASYTGVNAVLAITGDSPDAHARENGSRGVFHLNSYGLFSYLDSLNREVFSEKPFTLAAALNVNALHFDVELERARKKIENGARMFFTQAIFTEESMKNLKAAKAALKVPIIAGIMPLAGYKNAVFLQNEVGGITLPDRLIASLKDASPETSKEIALGFCERILDGIYDDCDGFCIMFPLKRVDLAETLLAFLQKKEQREETTEKGNPSK